MSEQDSNLRDQLNSGNTSPSPGATQHNANGQITNENSSMSNGLPRENAHWYGQPVAEDAQTPQDIPEITTYLYRSPNSEDAQTPPITPQIDTHLYRPLNPETPRAQRGMPLMNGHWYGESDAGTASESSLITFVNGCRYGEENAGTTLEPPLISLVNGRRYEGADARTASESSMSDHWHEEGDAETYQPSPSTPSAPHVNGNTENPPAPDNSQGNPRGQRQADSSRPQGALSPEPTESMHQVVIEFQPPPNNAPVVSPELPASRARSFHGDYYGGTVSSLGEQPQASELSQTAEEPRTSHQPQSSAQSRSSENYISYLPIRPSPSTINSSNRSETPLPPTHITKSVDEAVWHEFDTALTPEAIAHQEVLLSTWNEQASTARTRAAEEEAHIRAVELESELLAQQHRRERSHRRRQRIRQAQAQAGDTSRNSASLISGLLVRLRERIRNRVEARGREQTQSHSLDRHHQDRSDISLHRLTHLMHALSASSSAPQPPSSTHTPPPPEQPPTSPSPSLDNNDNLCAICLTNPGTLIQGPLSQSLADIIRFVCCQGCLNEILEAEVQVASAAAAGETVWNG